jgi:hypothetical protein
VESNRSSGIDRRPPRRYRDHKGQPQHLSNNFSGEAVKPLGIAYGIPSIPEARRLVQATASADGDPQGDGAANACRCARCR